MTIGAGVPARADSPWIRSRPPRTSDARTRSWLVEPVRAAAGDAGGRCASRSRSSYTPWTSMKRRFRQPNSPAVSVHGGGLHRPVCWGV